jgi:hypothetical protein
MSKPKDPNVVKLQRAQWFYSIVAGLGFVAPMAWTKFGPNIAPTVANATSGANSWLFMAAWAVAICSAFIGLIYGGRVFFKRPLHLLTILPILACVGVLVQARQLIH